MATNLLSISITDAGCGGGDSLMGSSLSQPLSNRRLGEKDLELSEIEATSRFYDLILVHADSASHLARCKKAIP